MKSKSLKSVLIMALGCLICCLTLMLGIMLGGSSLAYASEGEEALAPTIVSVGGKAIGSSNIGNFPSAIVNEEYKDADENNYKIIATGSGKLTYSANEYNTGSYGEMPEGLHLNSETGEFYGTITSAGTFGVSITVSNEYGSTNVLCYISVYTASDKPVIKTESLPDGAVGSVYSQYISYDGLKSALDVSIKSGNLPTGLSLGRSGFDAWIYGTPTQAGSYTFTLSMNNGAGIATKEYTIEIKEENIVPELINSATIVNESDKYSSIEASSSSLYIHVVKGKEVNVQLVASGTNTTENPIKYELFGTHGVLPDGLTMSESGLITGTVSNDIETSGGKTQINTYIMIGNKTVGGEPQSSSDFIYIVVHDNGYVDRIDLDPQITSVAKGGTRQFNIVWTGYGDIDKDVVTWSFVESYLPTSSQTTISNTGLLTVGIDEERTKFYIRATHSSSQMADATVTVVDHTHTTTLVEEKAKTCTEDGNIKHYKCTICDAVFEDVLATKSLSADAVKIPAGHDCGDIIPKQDATCSNTGKEAHYKCSVCEKIFTSEMVETTETNLVIAKDETAHKYGTIIAEVPATCTSTGMQEHYECSECHKLFNSSKVEKTEDDLKIAIDPTAHKYGTWQNEVPANCAEEGTKAHKTCEYCHKNFDNEGTEITDLTIAKNDNHDKQDTWTNDSTGHWHKCTRSGCKDGGKVDFVEHTPSATEPTENTDVHCTVCEYVIQAVKDHTHNLELVAGTAKTCYADGVKSYYVCQNGDHPCGRYFTDETGTTEISASELDTWKVIPAGHEFGDWQAEVPATTENDGIKAHKDCSVCHKHFDNDGNEITDLTIPKLAPTDPTTPDTPVTPDDPTTPSEPVDPTDPTEPTEPTEPTTPSDEQKDGLSGGAIAGIAIGSVAVAGLGGFAIFWFVIKKKKWADLVAVFKNLFAKK